MRESLSRGSCSILYVHTAEDGLALDIQLPHSRCVRARRNRLVGEAAENPGALRNHDPGRRHFDFDTAEDRADMNDRRLARHPGVAQVELAAAEDGDRKSTRLNSSHIPL